MRAEIAHLIQVFGEYVAITIGEPIIIDDSLHGVYYVVQFLLIETMVCQLALEFASSCFVLASRYSSVLMGNVDDCTWLRSSRMRSKKCARH